MKGRFWELVREFVYGLRELSEEVIKMCAKLFARYSTPLELEQKMADGGHPSRPDRPWEHGWTDPVPGEVVKWIAERRTVFQSTETRMSVAGWRRRYNTQRLHGAVRWGIGYRSRDSHRRADQHVGAEDVEEWSHSTVRT